MKHGDDNLIETGPFNADLKNRKKYGLLIFFCKNQPAFQPFCTLYSVHVQYPTELCAFS